MEAYSIPSPNEKSAGDERLVFNQSLFFFDWLSCLSEGFAHQINRGPGEPVDNHRSGLFRAEIQMHVACYWVAGASKDQAAD